MEAVHREPGFTALHISIIGGAMEYVNIFDWKNPLYPFQIFIGGRGTGKTYSALCGALDKSVVPDNFIYMRRTANELKTILDDDKRGEGANPFKPVNRNNQTNIGFRLIQDNIAGIYHREPGDNGKLMHTGAPIGYGLALSTIASIRGIDFSDCSDWFYDEFIKERHVRAITDEGGALLNAYETVNRNRELDGKPPIRLWLLANSNDIYNPIFNELGIVSEVEKMLRTGKSDRYLKERGLAIHLLQPAGSFIEAKKETALYKLTKGTRFYDMAIDNKFAYNDFSNISYRNVTGYAPVCAINDICYVYKKKGEKEIYVTYTPAKTPMYHTAQKNDELRFRREMGSWLQPFYVAGKMIFESYELKEMLVNLLI